MAGLLGFTLADLSGAVDSRKRQYANLVRGLLSDPGATLAQLAAVDAEAARGNRYTQMSAGSVMPEVAQQGQEAMLNAALNVGGLLGITAYHGSPHTFDKFDMSKIGTGEGAQAYGHGLYFAENPQVAEGYAGMRPAAGRSTLNGKPWDAQSYAEMIAEARTRGAGTYSKAETSLQKELDSALAGREHESAQKYQDALAALRGMRDKGVQVNTGQNLYKVDIPDEAVSKMLDWDKPLSQQPEAVRKALEPIIAPLRKEAAKNVSGWGDLGKAYNIDNELTGQQIVELMRTKIPSVSNIIGGGGPVVTNKLRELGIPGIRYLDAGSRGKGGTSNFVLFDDKLPKILSRE